MLLMRFTFKTQALLGIAAFICVALTLAAVILFPRSRMSGPAELLPAESTLAYIERYDSSQSALITSLLPGLLGVPVSDEPSTIAIVKMNDGTNAWIRFAREGEAAITSSNQSALAMLGTGAMLSDNDTFAALSRTNNSAGLWAYVRPQDVPPAVNTAIRTPETPFAISIAQDGVRVAWEHAGEAMATVSDGQKMLFANPVLAVQAGDMKDVLSRASSLLGDGTRLAYEGALRAWFSRNFGSELSPVYDLSPLLDGRSALTIGQNNDGTYAAVLEGNIDDAETHLNKLHEGARSSLTGVVRVQRTFDEQFEQNNLRADESAVADEERDVSGWTLRETAINGRGLYSARNGDRFILSNNAALLRKALETSASVQEGSGNAIARGTLNSATARQALRNLLPEEELPLPAGLLLKADIHWEWLRQGRLSVLRVY
jgi:hypothetical protein